MDCNFFFPLQPATYHQVGFHKIRFQVLCVYLPTYFLSCVPACSVHLNIYCFCPKLDFILKLVLPTFTSLTLIWAAEWEGWRIQNSWEGEGSKHGEFWTRILLCSGPISIIFPSKTPLVCSSRVYVRRTLATLCAGFFCSLHFEKRISVCRVKASAKGDRTGGRLVTGCFRARLSHTFLVWSCLLLPPICNWSRPATRMIEIKLC